MNLFDPAIDYKPLRFAKLTTSYGSPGERCVICDAPLPVGQCVEVLVLYAQYEPVATACTRCRQLYADEDGR
jgi:cytidine deaminase